MIMWIVRGLVLIAGPLISYFQISHTYHGLFVGLLISSVVIIAEIIIQRFPLDAIAAAVVGIVFGLVAARLMDFTVSLTDNQRILSFMNDYSLLLKVLLAYIGLIVAVSKKSELDFLNRDILKTGRPRASNDLVVLDASAIIDGRIADITEVKFIAGTVIVPRFVVAEIQAQSDSADTFKRNRARRGLDILAKLQKDPGITVKISDKDYPAIKGTEEKLVELAKDLGGKIATTDFNLNKAAMLQGITVLNVSDLSNTLKPVYLPGETMPIFLVKEGKEINQAIGYLNDGTMVVIEDGRKNVGKRIDVIVTSILQTSTGRMVFAKTAGGTSPQSQRNEQS